MNANAYTVGHNIVFGTGRFTLGTYEGRRLFAHELTQVVQQSSVEGSRIDQSSENRGLSQISPLSITHMIQQGGAPSAQLQADNKGKGKPTKKVTKITFFIDRNIVVLELDGKSTIALLVVYNGEPAPGIYIISGETIHATNRRHRKRQRQDR